MKKKAAFLCSLIMLLTAACGKINEGSDTDEEPTTASEAESSSEAESEENTEVSEKFGTEFSLFPDIKLGMTEKEVQAVIGDNYERSVEKYLDINPEIAYYTVPFDSCPFLGIDMEGYELFAFIPDGELISMSYNFGVIDRDNNTSKEHSEEEMKAVYDTLFDQIHEHYGDYFTSTDVGTSSLGNLNWDNTYGSLTLWGFYYDDTKEGNVSLSQMADDFAQKILDHASENKDSISSDTAASDILVLLREPMKKDEAFNIIGSDYTYKEELNNRNIYEYEFDSDTVFGTNLKGSMYFESDIDTDEVRCCGYHIGVVGFGEDQQYPYSEEELTNAFDKIMKALIKEYGNEYEEEEYSFYGERECHIWNDPPGSIWALYGIDLWGENSGRNYIIISRDIETDKD